MLDFPHLEVEQATASGGRRSQQTNF